MSIITIGNKGLNPNGGGIPSSKLRINFENQRVVAVFSVKLAVELKSENLGKEQAFDYLMLCCNEGRISSKDTEQIFEECF